MVVFPLRMHENCYSQIPFILPITKCALWQYTQLFLWLTFRINASFSLLVKVFFGILICLVFCQTILWICSGCLQILNKAQCICCVRKNVLIGCSYLFSCSNFKFILSWFFFSILTMQSCFRIYVYKMEDKRKWMDNFSGYRK